MVVLDAAEVPDEFDARRSATGRTYRYLVWNAPAPDPLLDPMVWHVRDPLDLRAMAAASDVLLGQPRLPLLLPAHAGHAAPTSPSCGGCAGPDGAPCDGPEMAGIGPGRLLRFEIEADSFCHQMVRSLVGSLVEVGRGRANCGHPDGPVAGVHRHRAADPAPPQGLCLVSVEYG